MTSSAALKAVRRVPSEFGLTVLGVPIGSDQFVTSQLQQFCESYSRALKQLEEFPNLQLGLQLLRVSMGVCRAYIYCVLSSWNFAKP